jgi:hypothetical protein
MPVYLCSEEEEEEEEEGRRRFLACGSAEQGGYSTSM